MKRGEETIVLGKKKYEGESVASPARKEETGTERKKEKNENERVAIE